MTGIILLDRADGGVPAAAFDKAGLGPADPFAAGREIAWTGPDAMSAGRVAFSGAADIASLPPAEIVVAGGLRVSMACANS